MKTRSTMTEILAKINMYGKRINRKLTIDNTELPTTLWVNLVKNSSDIIQGIPVSDVEENIKDSYKSVDDLIKNYIKLNMIRNAVNLTVKIDICGTKMTIAEALAYNRADVKKYWEAKIKKMQANLSSVNAMMTKYNNDVFSDDRVNGYLSVALGGVQQSDLKNVPADKIKELIDAYHEQNDCKLVDPLGIEKLIEKEVTKYEDFYNNVNYKLSAINSRIVIEYDLDKDYPEWSVVNMEDVESADNLLVIGDE